MRAYIDTDVLAGHLWGARQALDFLHDLRADGAYELWIGAMQRAEIVFFMKPEEEEQTLLFLVEFKKAELLEGVQTAEDELKRLRAERKKTPRKVPLATLPEEQR
ncbi:MAG: hypothetical protein NTU83_05530, partial [Candidatus Hydrogenedentes bacterium]|nr:hypothetical protein [Candidatus Hydrogenedentota bacterium]